MRLKLSLLMSVTIVVAYVTAAAKDRSSDAFSLYPFNNYPYYIDPTPSKNNADAHRQMLTMSFVIPAVNFPSRLTILETLTSTTTIVCTKSVSNQCSVRRRTQRPWRVNRPAMANNNYGTGKTDDFFNLLLDEDNENQFPIFPSAVQGVEATQLPGREGRAADPQVLVLTSRYYDNKPEEIESGFRTDNFNPVALPFNRRFPSGNGQRQQFLQNLMTVTRRTTILEMDISTSTPACSTLGRLPQCPPEKPPRQCVWD